MQALIDFFKAHALVLAPFGIAVLDLLFALNPASKSNGILHWIYVTLGGKSE